jgi:hypothetical protein
MGRKRQTATGSQTRIVFISHHSSDHLHGFASVGKQLGMHLQTMNVSRVLYDPDQSAILITPAEGDTPATMQRRAEPLAIDRRVSARTVLDCWAALLPSRVLNEELGDYLEDIARRTTDGQGRFRIGLRVVSAMFWTGLNAVGYALKLLGKHKSA